AMFVSDVLPYEEMKLRMLNGSHSFLAYNGSLAGYEFIYQCMEDDAFKTAVHHLMTEEQAKSLRPNLAVDVHQYAQLLIERFSNPNIKHKTGQIAMDGSQKLPQRAVDPYLTLQARGVKGRALATLIAGWLHYVINTLSQGQSVADPLNDTFNAAIKNKNTRWEQALSLLQINSIFGTLAGDNADFLNDIQQAFNHIELHGVTATIHRLSSKG
ncbi:fructuronate reductase, partial [Salmonella enterica subsp. enterica serovar Thompson]|nr:fructuronate reductase [Salmonella enterica subsp. enterica serovar Thompson]